jgi:hypothetical protein
VLLLVVLLPALLQVQAFTVEAVLAGILYMRVQHYTEQLALIAVLDLLLQQQPQVLPTVASPPHIVCVVGRPQFDMFAHMQVSTLGFLAVGAGSSLVTAL